MVYRKVHLNIIIIDVRCDYEQYLEDNYQNLNIIIIDVRFGNLVYFDRFNQVFKYNHY